MTEDQALKRHGSLIRLKPEYEERYIILHRHTFPGVLERIRNSNIRNYSIYLRDGMLFSFYEYIGTDFSDDMEQIGADTVTRDWWKLTDPMQVPLETRKEGEWWAEMTELLRLVEGTESRRKSPALAQRFAYVAHTGIPGPLDRATLRDSVTDIDFQTLSLYAKDDCLYVYLECEGRDERDQKREARDAGLARFLETLSPAIPCAGWHPMREVFHTD